MLAYNPLTKVTEFRFKMYIEDFESVRKFYTEVLQFPIAQEWNDDPMHRGIMFDTGTGIIEFLPAKNGYIPIVGGDLSLKVNDVRALWEYVQDKATVVFPIRENSWGDISFCISDPAGLHITFFSPIP